MKTKRVLVQMLLLLGMVFVGLTGFTPTAAAADISVTVRSIAASKDGKSVDPKLKDIQSTLNVTFAGYTNFKQLGSRSVSLAQGSSKSVSLPNNDRLTLTFNGYAGDLVKLGLGISDKMNTTLRVSPGSTFFQAGLRYKSGIMILAITVKPQ